LPPGGTSTAARPAPDRGQPLVIFLAAAIAALGSFLFGYDTGVISGAILFIRQDAGLTGGAPMPTAVEEAVVSAVLLGAVVGAASGGRLSDRLGRRSILILAGLMFVAGSLGCMLAPNVATLIGFRLLIGVAIGGASLLVPLYIAELAPASLRGTLVSINQLGIVTGILAAYLIDYALAGSADWRAMFGFGMIPAALLAAGMALMPESPRWLVAHGRRQDAQRVLSRLRGGSDVARELEDIGASIRKQRADLRMILAPAVRPALVIGITLAILQQVTGINTVIYYAPTIIENAGLSSATASLLATTGVGIVNLLATVTALWLVDRLGRRPLLLASLIGMALSMAVLGLVFALAVRFGAIGGGVAVLAMMAYVAFFAVGLGPVFWLLIAEIYPLRLRGVAMSIASVANWGANLLVASTFLTLSEAIGRPATFWLFGLLGVLAAVFVHRRVPETKGRSLEEIEQAWRAEATTP
jgi:SP family galactose:H+ symporter-like MFS transporter